MKYLPLVIALISFSLAGCGSPDGNASGAGRTGAGEGPVSLERIAWKVVSRAEVDTLPAIGRLGIATVNAAGVVQVVEPVAGDTVWRNERERPTLAAPAWSGESLIVGDELGFVARLDAPDGKQKWEVEIGGPISSIVVDQGVAYAATIDGTINALAVADGKRLWGVQLGAAITSPIAYAEDLVAVGSSDGKVHAMSAITGKPSWAADCPGHPVSAVATTFDAVFAACEETVIRVGRDGKAAWTAALDGRISTGIAVSEELLAVGTESGRLVALSTLDGAERWRFQAKEPFWGPLAIGTQVYAANHDGRVYAVDRGSGDSSFEFRAESRPLGGVTAHGGRLYFGDVDGNLYAIE